MPSYSIIAENFKFELTLTKVNSWPTWYFDQDFRILNLVESGCQQTVLVEIDGINNRKSITLVRGGKTESETLLNGTTIIRDQVLSINRMWVNDVLVESPVLKKISKFYPSYSQDNIDYATLHQLSLPEVKYETDLFYNGKWVLEFEQPFFLWYSDILLNEIAHFNHWVKQTHLGIGNDEQFAILRSLLEKLS